MMRAGNIAAIAMALLLPTSAALSQELPPIFACTDANGKVQYRNTGDLSSCKRLALPQPKVTDLQSTSANYGALPHPGIIDGNKLIQWADATHRIEQRISSDKDVIDAVSSGMLYGYITGIYDANSGKTVCPSHGAKVGQMIAIAEKSVRAQPELWNGPASRLVINALSTAFPCRK